MWDLEEDLKAVSEMLGHSTLQVTADLYTKMSMNKKKKLSSRFGQAMDEAKSVDN
jgi:site-specific recombinase XerC